MERTEFRKSRIKAAGLFLASIALVVGCAFAAGRADEPFMRIVGAVGVVFFGIGLVKTFRDLFSSEIAYVIDDRGIDDRVTGIGLIPWSAITAVGIFAVRGTEVLLLSLDNPEQYIARLTPFQRRMSSLSRTTGLGDWSLSFVGISPGIETAKSLIAARLSL